MFKSASILVALVLALMSSPITSQAQSATIYGCVAKDGSVRIVAAGTVCSKTEYLTSWNQVGPQGPAGPAGTTGQSYYSAKDNYGRFLFPTPNQGSLNEVIFSIVVPADPNAFFMVHTHMVVANTHVTDRRCLFSTYINANGNFVPTEMQAIVPEYVGGDIQIPIANTQVVPGQAFSQTITLNYDVTDPACTGNTGLNLSSRSMTIVMLKK